MIQTIGKKYIFAISTGVLISITAIIPFIMHFANQEVVTRDSYVLLKDLEKELAGENTKNNETRLDNLIDEFLQMEKPTKEIIREFIEKIEIHSDKQVDIYFNFKIII